MDMGIGTETLVQLLKSPEVNSRLSGNRAVVQIPCVPILTFKMDHSYSLIPGYIKVECASRFKVQIMIAKKDLRRNPSLRKD